MSSSRAYVAPGNRPKTKNNAKGHEMVLNAIQHDQRDITIELMDSDETVTGKLVAFDAYTMSIEVDAHAGRTNVYFKHAIRCFHARKKTAPAV